MRRISLILVVFTLLSGLTSCIDAIAPDDSISSVPMTNNPTYIGKSGASMMPSSAMY